MIIDKQDFFTRLQEKTVLRICESVVQFTDQSLLERLSGEKQGTNH